MPMMGFQRKWKKGSVGGDRGVSCIQFLFGFWNLFNFANCILFMVRFDVTVEPLLYDHSQNHIGVVV